MILYRHTYIIHIYGGVRTAKDLYFPIQHASADCDKSMNQWISYIKKNRRRKIYDLIGTPMWNRSGKCNKLWCVYLRSVLILSVQEKYLPGISFMFLFSCKRKQTFIWRRRDRLHSRKNKISWAILSSCLSYVTHKGRWYKVIPAADSAWYKCRAPSKYTS